MELKFSGWSIGSLIAFLTLIAAFVLLLGHQLPFLLAAMMMALALSRLC